MQNRNLRLSDLALAVFVMVFLPLAARAEDPANNPQFDGWSRFNVGATVTHVSTMNTGTMNLTSEIVTVLVAKADDHVILEATATIKAGTTTRTKPPERITIRARGDAAKKPIANETIEVAGEKFDCKVYLLKQTPPNAPVAGKAEVKAWFSDKVPGGMVQMVTSTPAVTSKAMLKSYSAK